MEAQELYDKVRRFGGKYWIELSAEEKAIFEAAAVSINVDTERVKARNLELGRTLSQIAVLCGGTGTVPYDMPEVVVSMVEDALAKKSVPPELWQGATVIRCPECGHGIDPHGVFPGGACGVGNADGEKCDCRMSPNGIAEALLTQRIDDYNPFASDNGLDVELVDAISQAPTPVHKSVKGIRVNGLDVSRWLARNGFKVNSSTIADATTLSLKLHIRSVRTVAE